MKYIDADKLVAEIERLDEKYRLIRVGKNIQQAREADLVIHVLLGLSNFITSLQQEQPEPYFYCKYGGILSLCSDCKRNHNNSSFKTEEITTWYSPSNGTKHCIDYIQQEQSVHSHYTKVRETKTGRVFLAEYSSEAAEWYEAGTGKAYSISDVEIVKEQPEVDLEKFDKDVTKIWGRCAAEPNDSIACLHIETFNEIARHFYELGLNARKEDTK